MAKRRQQFWLIWYYLPNIKEKQYSTSPAMKYPWQVKMWLLNQKPSADIIRVEPYRSMAIPNR